MIYITEYGKLNPKEKRQLNYKRRFKKDFPQWDDSMVLLTKLFDTYTNNNIKVLDAGCGHGNFVIDELSEKIRYTVGVDVDKSATTRNKCVDKIVIADLSKLPFKKNEFDAIVSQWVLEHVQNPHPVFSEIYRVLKPGGIFAFVTPNINSHLISFRRLVNQEVANYLVEKLYGRSEKDIFPTIYQASSIKTLRELAKKSKFEAVELKTNFDPSYTSFNNLTYMSNKALYLSKISFFHPHILGVFKKR